MDLLFYFLDIKICEKISSYLSDNENFIVAYRLRGIFLTDKDYQYY